ncbi:MAG: hypothetical protein KDA59_26510 [Planctomycetales bacterium]|nr:hypothetical protein [Planctomycetales bacterium]
MSGIDFINVIRTAFAPFVGDLGFERLPEQVSGKLYSVDFARHDVVVSIFFEPGDKYAETVVFKCKNGVRSPYDDRTATPRLPDLNRKYMGQISTGDRAANNAFFAALRGQDADEEQLLRTALQLRLVLPMYLADQSSGEQLGSNSC